MTRFLRRCQRELSVAAGLSALLLILAVYRPDFYAPGYLTDLAVENAPLLVAAVGMTLVMLARQIDISIGSQIAVCGVFAGLLARAGVPMLLVVPATLAGGALLGAVNGALVAFANLPSIVVTLATMIIWAESLRWYQQGALVDHLPAAFQWLGQSQAIGQALILITASVVFVAFALALRYLSAGRAVYATGSNQEAARLVGIRPRRVTLAVFIVMGTLSALAALLYVLCFPHVNPKVGTGDELRAIAAVVIGGVAVSGGRGTLIGTLLGVALLGTIKPALVFLDISAYWAQAIQGAIILLAVVSDVFSSRRN